MWHDIVSRTDATTQLLSFAAVDLFYRYPLVFCGTVLAFMMLASMLCFEFRKSENLPAERNADFRTYDRPLKLRR